jgi:hypothetical protein
MRVVVFQLREAAENLAILSLTKPAPLWRLTLDQTRARNAIAASV